MADPERVTPPQGGAPDPLAEQVIESRLAWRGTFFEVQSELVRCPDGHVGAREFIRHPGAVMVIALLPDGRILLERQWRHPLRQSFIEMPAGKLAPGEDPLACARRELLEETGARSVRLLGRTGGWVAYRFPEGYRRSKAARGWLGQKQIWFAFRFTGDESEFDLAGHHQVEFDRWRWADLDEALEGVAEFKRDTYREVIETFRALIVGQQTA